MIVLRCVIPGVINHNRIVIIINITRREVRLLSYTQTADKKSCNDSYNEGVEMVNRKMEIVKTKVESKRTNNPEKKASLRKKAIEMHKQFIKDFFS